MSSYCRVEILKVMLKAPILWYRTPPRESADFNKLDQVSKALVLLKDDLGLVSTDLDLVSPAMLKVTEVHDGIVLDIKCFIHKLRVCGELRHGGWIYAVLNLGIGVSLGKVVHYPEKMGLVYSTSELLPSDHSTVALEAHLIKEFNLPEFAEDIVQFDRRPPTRFERAWVI